MLDTRNDKVKFIAISVAFFLLFFWLRLSLGYSKGTSSFNITYNIADPIKLKDGTDVRYTPNCLVNCYLPIEFYYSGSIAPASKTIMLSDLSYVKKKISGLDNLIDLKFNLIRNETYKEEIWIPNISCFNYTANSSIYQNCTDNGYHTNITLWGYFLKDLAGAITLNKKEHYILLISGKKLPSTNFSAVDIVPNIYSYNLDELAWFNSSFTKCRNITVANPTTNYTAVINVSYDSDMVANFSDLRFVNSSCNNGGSELAHFQRTYVASSWETEDIKLDGTQTVISVYYGLATAGSTSSISNVWGSDLLVYTTLDEGSGTNIINLADKSNNGTLSGSGYGWHNATEGVCRKGGCLSFSSAGGNYILFTSQLALNSYTVLQWINASGTGTTEECSFSWENYPGSPRQMNIMSHNRGSNKIYYWEIQVGGTGGSSTNSSSLLQWTSIGSVRSSTTAKAYKNSTQIGGAITVASGSFTTSSLALGAHYYSSAANEKYNGYMDDTLIWNRALSDTEVANLYAATEPTFTLGSEETEGAGTTPTSIREWLNSAENNLTLGYGYSNLNLTALINVSGLSVSIMKNSTILTTATTRAETTSNGLAAGYYNFNANYSGNATYGSSSQSYYLTVSQATPSCTLSLTPSSPIDYETNTTAVCGCNSTDTGVSVKLYRNNSDVSSQNNTIIRLAAGGYNYICNSTATANFTVGTTNSNYVVNKKNAAVVLSPTNSTISYNASTTQYCTDSSSLYNCQFWRNGTSVSNNTNIVFGAGAYVYVSNITDTVNYTNYQITNTLTVNPSDPQLDIVFDPSSTVIQGTSVNVSCTTPFPELTLPASLHNSTSLISNPSTVDTSGMAIGSYGYWCNNVATQNLTASNITEDLTITSSSGFSLNIYNEENTSQGLTFNLTINNGTTSNTVYNQNNPYVNNSILGAITVDVSGSNYPQRTYYITVANGSSTSLNGYLLTSSSGSWILFYVFSPYDQPIENALINVERLIPPSSYLTIAQKKTDVSGSASIFLSPITTYRFNVSSPLYSTKTFTLQPAASPYVIYLNSSTTIDYNATYKNIRYWIDPLGSALVNNTTAFNFTIVSYDSQIQYYGLNITYSNGTSFYYSNSTGSAGGSKTTSINLAAYTGSVYLTAFFKKYGFSQVNIYKTYYIYNTIVPGETSLVGLATYIKDTEEMGEFSWGIISLFLTLITMGLASKEFSWAGSGLVGLAAMAVFTYLGVMIFGAGYWMGYNLLFGIAVALFGMLYLRSGG